MVVAAVMSVPETFAALVKRAREQRGWSLREVGRRAQVPHGDVSAVERGMRATATKVAHIAQALDIPLDAAAESSGHSIEALALATRPMATTEDPLVLIERSLREGGWARETRLALLHLVAQTRPPEPVPEPSLPPTRVGDDLKTLRVGRDEDVM